MVVQVGSQKYRRTFKKIIFTFNLLPNLAKSSYGSSSPLWLNHKINKKKKHWGREAGREIGRKEGRKEEDERKGGREGERERERERGRWGQDWRSCRFMGVWFFTRRVGVGLGRSSFGQEHKGIRCWCCHNSWRIDQSLPHRTDLHTHNSWMSSSNY